MLRIGCSGGTGADQEHDEIAVDLGSPSTLIHLCHGVFVVAIAVTNTLSWRVGRVRDCRMNRRSPAGLSPKSVLGVPFLPPGRGHRLRQPGHGRSSAGMHARMAPPPVRILEGIFGMLDHRVLVALCAAGVPDALDPTTDAPAASRDSSVSTPTDSSDCCGSPRHVGGCASTGRGRVRPTAVTAVPSSGPPRRMAGLGRLRRW